MTPYAIFTAVVTLMCIGTLLAAALSYRTVAPHEALVLRTMQATRVRFAGALVLPLVHRAEVMDLRPRAIVIDREGERGVRLRDGSWADLELTLLVRVKPTRDDILAVAGSVGCERATDHATIRVLFEEKLIEAIEVAAAEVADFDTFLQEQERFRWAVIEQVGKELGGWLLDQVALTHLAPGLKRLN